MTGKQRAFAEAYIKTGNACESAIKSGYSKSYAESKAYSLLDNPEISDYIRDLTSKVTDESILSAKECQKILSDIAKDDENYPSDRIRAIDTLFKSRGEYIQKMQVAPQDSGLLEEILEQLKT